MTPEQAGEKAWRFKKNNETLLTIKEALKRCNSAKNNIIEVRMTVGSGWIEDDIDKGLLEEFLKTWQEDIVKEQFDIRSKFSKI